MKGFIKWYLVLFLALYVANSKASGLRNYNNVGVFYNADLGIYPGLGGFLSYNLSSTEKTRGKREIEVLRVLSLRPTVSYIMYPRVGSVLNPALLLNYSLGRKKGIYSEIETGLGLIHQFNAGKTYQLNSQGGITERNLAFRTYWSVETNFAIGLRTAKQSAYYLKLVNLQQFPYNSVGFVPRFILQIGFTKTIAL
ncbi:MAG: hypothetical protein KDC92_11910 [Bacteroidetes bacterium]|nr:hypothetical protein [Bacteroidota bacterium]